MTYAIVGTIFFLAFGTSMFALGVFLGVCLADPKHARYDQKYPPPGSL